MKRFDLTGAIVAATPSIFKLNNASDNPTYYTQDTLEVTADCWFDGFTVTTDAACKVEFGLTNAATNAFTPLYATYIAGGSAGGCDNRFNNGRPTFGFSAATVKLLALRVTVAADATVKLAGHLDYSKI